MVEVNYIRLIKTSGSFEMNSMYTLPTTLFGSNRAVRFGADRQPVQNPAIFGVEEMPQNRPATQAGQDRHPGVRALGHGLLSAVTGVAALTLNDFSIKRLMKGENPTWLPALLLPVGLVVSGLFGIQVVKAVRAVDQWHRERLNQANPPAPETAPPQAEEV